MMSLFGSPFAPSACSDGCYLVGRRFIADKGAQGWGSSIGEMAKIILLKRTRKKGDY